jgi:hypothetical protein
VRDRPIATRLCGALCAALAIRIMVTKQEARAIALGQASGAAGELPSGDEIIILDDATIECQRGWMFFYTSKRWEETKDIRYALGGNAPIIVEKSTGKLHVSGTAHPAQHYIQRFELTGNPHG